jgi:Cu2+-exporting ATPase
MAAADLSSSDGRQEADGNGAHHHTGHVSPVETHAGHPHASTGGQGAAHAGNHMAHGDTQGDGAEAPPMIHDAQADAHGAGHVHEAHEHGAAGREPAGHPSGHSTHVDHTGYEQMFRLRFWVSLILSVPVLLYSPMLQKWLGFTMPAFPGSDWIAPLFAVAIFIYGGVPFLRMAVPELRSRRPGMMTLISLAISVALVYSLAALLLPAQEGFFWELVTLIDIMLLGHWIEMRSVRQASGALDELAKLMPDTAERIHPDGSTEEIPVSRLGAGDWVLVRPGAGIPVDGEVQEGESDVDEAMITGESRPVSKVPGNPVIAGTINGDGSLRVRVTASAPCSRRQARGIISNFWCRASSA